MLSGIAVETALFPRLVDVAVDVPPKACIMANKPPEPVVVLSSLSVRYEKILLSVSVSVTNALPELESMPCSKEMREATSAEDNAFTVPSIVVLVAIVLLVLLVLLILLVLVEAGVVLANENSIFDTLEMSLRTALKIGFVRDDLLFVLVLFLAALVVDRTDVVLGTTI